MRLQISRFIMVLGCLFFSFSALLAQSNPVTVPDLSGLKVPQAAAILNQAGLKLGTETNVGWVEGTVTPPNTISTQSTAAGQTVDRGTTIDVTIPRNLNALLIYDDNDITFVNQTNGALDMNSITFSSVEGNPAVFAGSRWFFSFDNNDCGQLWSVQRNAPKEQPECTESMYWLALVNDRSVHFWTTTNAVAKFAVLQNGIQRAICDAAPPGTQDAPYRCAMYLPTATTDSDVTPYLYFVYTPDSLIIRNRAEDAWMPLADLTITNAQNISDTIPSLLAATTVDAIYDLNRLAPNQCLHFTAGGGTTTPEACNVIATATPTNLFWQTGFSFISTTDGKSRSCPPAQAGKLTLCILPR
jgi:hypothetical protein